MILLSRNFGHIFIRDVTKKHHQRQSCENPVAMQGPGNCCQHICLEELALTIGSQRVSLGLVWDVAVGASSAKLTVFRL